MTKTFSARVKTELESLTADLTEQIKRDASAAGWPQNLAQALSVSATDSGISVDYPKRLAAQIEDLEYGTPSTPPKAVIRLFATKYDNDIAATLESAVSGYFVEDTGLL